MKLQHFRDILRKEKTRSEPIVSQTKSEWSKNSVPTLRREVHFKEPISQIQQKIVLSCPQLTGSKLELNSEVQAPVSQSSYIDVQTSDPQRRKLTVL